MPKKAPKLDDRVIADFVAWVRMGAPDPRDQPEPVAAKAKKSWAQTLAERRHVVELSARRESRAAGGQRPGLVARIRSTASSSRSSKRRVSRPRRPPMRARSPAGSASRSLACRRRPKKWKPSLATRERSALSTTSRNSQLLDRLLASPHFGEHWARHWMDVVRYADTHGSEHDSVEPVGVALSRLPHPRLQRRRALRSVRARADRRRSAAAAALERIGVNESVIGTAMHRFVEYYDTPVDPKREEAIVIDNQIDTLGKAFQGLTLGCARCHDHKFDPISAQDFYALYGIFSSSRAAMQIIDAPETLCAHDADLRRLRAEIAQALAALWREEARALPQRLRESLREEKGPLPALRRARARRGRRFPEGVAGSRSERQTAAPSLPPDAVVFADFSKGDLARLARERAGTADGADAGGIPEPRRRSLAAAGSRDSARGIFLRANLRAPRRQPAFAGFHDRKEIRQRARDAVAAARARGWWSRTSKAIACSTRRRIRN